MAAPNSLLSGRILRNAATHQAVTAALRGTTANAINFAAAAANHANPPYHIPTTSSAMDYEHHPHLHQTPYGHYEHAYRHPLPQLCPQPRGAAHTSSYVMARTVSEPEPGTGSGDVPVPGSVAFPVAAAEAAYPSSEQSMNVVGVYDEAVGWS